VDGKSRNDASDITHTALATGGDFGQLQDKPDLRSIAIVGGSGFVGSALTKHLSSRFKVTVLDRRQPSGSYGSFKACDVRDKPSLKQALQGFDLVINTAVIQLPEINENKRLGYEVNVLGVQNLCETLESIDSIKGLVHASSWHVFGEKGLRGTLDEGFGFRPDKIEQRAKFYAICKIAQEAVIRISNEMSSKSYGIIRMGTVLGEAMPTQTAASIFIEKALKGEPITPFKETMHRPMLYVDIHDVCKAFESLGTRILNGELMKQGSAAELVNLAWPSPLTIVELARTVQRSFIKLTDGTIAPKIEVVDKGVKPIYTPRDKQLFKLKISKARKFLGLKKLTSPQESIDRIIANRIRAV
jgi:nucleoside-diphosphate-sugar epimerase